MHPFFQDTKNFVLDTLFPMQCLGCNQEGLFLCPNCQTKLRRLQHQQCIICRMPSFAGTTHIQCRNLNTPDTLISAFDYHDSLLAQSIIWGKYKFLPGIYDILGKLLVQYLEQADLDNLIAGAILCPIPLAKQRLRWRGFNQAEVISKMLSQHFSWNTKPLLKRVKNTKTQKDLTKAGRLDNVANSFVVANGTEIKNKRIILVDDVITTGATLLEAARLLKSAGANNICCLTVARD